MEPAVDATQVQSRLADLSAAATWTCTAIGVAVELGLPSLMSEPSRSESLAAATGVSVPLATSLAEALVAGGPAERTNTGFVAVPGLTELVDGPYQEIRRANLRSGLLQLAAFFNEATHGQVETGLGAHGRADLASAERDLRWRGQAPGEQVLPGMAGLRERFDSGLPATARTTEMREAAAPPLAAVTATLAHREEPFGAG